MTKVKGDFIGHFHCVANEFDDKEPCSSSDGLAIYMKQDEDGCDIYDGYCWVCHQSFFKDEIHRSSLCEELGISNDGTVSERKFTPKPKPEPLTKEEVQKLKLEVGFYDKPYRCLEPEWMKFFGHMVKRDTNGVPTAVYYPETENNIVSGFKIRVLPKRFSKVGRTGKSSQLSGQFRYRSPSKRILYVGGENDKVAAYGALLKYGVHVVSPTTGEGSAADQAAAQYEFFDGYEEIYVGQDNDEKGSQANEDICKVLPANKVKVVKWSDNDPHKLLEDGKHQQIVRDFFNAKDYIDSGIKSAADATTEVVEFLTAPKIPLPPNLKKLEDAMRGGIKSTGAIINICAETSIGKSLFSDNLAMYWFFNSPLIPTIISLERTAGELLTDLYSLHLKKNLTWFKDGDDAIAYLDKPEVKKLCEDLVYDSEGFSRFYIIDERDGKIENLKRQVDRAIKQYGSRLIIFDPLTDFLRSLGNEAQEDFMMWQKMMKKEGIVFVNVLHTRKPAQSKDNAFKKVTEYEVLGSGTFVQSADINLVLNRNKMAECPIERNTTTVDMPKCRGGVTGEIMGLYYDSETRQQVDVEDYNKGGRQNNPDYVSVETKQSVDVNPFDNIDLNFSDDNVLEGTF